MPTVEIPEEHYEAFEKRAAEKDLADAEAYIGYVLEQVYEKLQRQEDEDEEESAYTEEEEEKVKERLRGLGYLD